MKRKEQHTIPDWKQNSNWFQYRKRLRAEWREYQRYLLANGLPWHYDPDYWSHP